MKVKVTLNMHTDVRLSRGSVDSTLTGADSAGVVHTVTITHPTAQAILALADNQPAGKHPSPANMHTDLVTGGGSAYNMHTDATVTSRDGGAVIEGDASRDGTAIALRIRIDHAALKHLHSSPAGI